MNRKDLLAEITAIENKMNKAGISESEKAFHGKQLNKARAKLNEMDKAEKPATEESDKHAELAEIDKAIEAAKTKKSEWEAKLAENPGKADFYNGKIAKCEQDIEEFEGLKAIIEEEILAAAKAKTNAIPATSAGKEALLEEKAKTEKWLSEAEDEDEKEMFKTDLDAINKELSEIEKAEKAAADAAKKAEQTAKDSTKKSTEAGKENNSGEVNQAELKAKLKIAADAAENLFNALKGIENFL